MSIIAYYIILQIILLNFFKKSYLLPCGLVGFSPVKELTDLQKEIVLYKIKILSLYNQERGTDGVGMFINGQIYKGYYEWQKKDTKLFKDFFCDPEIAALKYEGGVIMTHTRKAFGGGVITKDNNHPFYIKSVSEKPENDMVLVHNGVIQNCLKLSSETGVPYTSYQVDSQGLGMMIDKAGLTVLNKYEGFATLLWTKMGNPNALYVYHGAYCKYKEDNPEKDLEEERPLYFLVTPEGTYFSSLASSLDAIAGKNEKSYNLTYNTVYKWENNKYRTVFTADRVKGPNTKDKPTYFTQTNAYGNYCESENDGCYNAAIMNRNRNLVNIDTHQKNATEKVSPKTSLIFTEQEPLQKAKGDRIYYHYGRYMESSGKLCENSYWLTKKGEISGSTNINASLFWFYRGIMLRNSFVAQQVREAIVAKKLSSDSTSQNFASEMSKYSKYPITSYLTESIHFSPYYRYAWWLDGIRVQGKKINPEFSSRQYSIDINGFLKEITSSDPEDKKLFLQEKPTSKNSFYDEVFTDINEFLSRPTVDQVFAVRFFVFDYLSKTLTRVNPDEYEVHNEILELAKVMIEKKQSLRDILEDKLFVLEDYEKSAKRYEMLDAKYFSKDSIKSLLGVNVIVPKKVSLVDESMLKITDAEIIDVEDVFDEPVINNTNIEIIETDMDGNTVDDNGVSKDVVYRAINDMISCLGDTQNLMEELSGFQNDRYAQEVSDFMFCEFETIKHKLATLASENGDIENENQINRTISKAI